MDFWVSVLRCSSEFISKHIIFSFYNLSEVKIEEKKLLKTRVTNTDVILLWCHFKHYFTTFTSHSFWWMGNDSRCVIHTYLPMRAMIYPPVVLNSVSGAAPTALHLSYPFSSQIQAFGKLCFLMLVCLIGCVQAEYYSLVLYWPQCMLDSSSSLSIKQQLKENL